MGHFSIQHYVPQFFLRLWADGTEQIYACRKSDANRKIFRPNVKNVAAERHFYKRFPFKEGSVEHQFILAYINDPRLDPPREQEAKQRKIALMDLFSALCGESTKGDSDDVYVERYINPIFEAAKSDLLALNQNKATLNAKSQVKLVLFLGYLQVRTPKLKQELAALEQNEGFPAGFSDRVFPYLAAMHAFDIGYWLTKFKIELLQSEAKFICTDFPIVNLSLETELQQIVCPIGPKLCLLLTEPDDFDQTLGYTSLPVRLIDEERTHAINLKIASYADEFIFADSEKVLSKYQL